MFLPEILLPLVFFSPVSQKMPDGAGAWTSPTLQNYPLKRPPAPTPNFASPLAVERMSLAMPHLRRQASLQSTAVVLQTRGGNEPLPVHPVFRNRMPGLANWGLDGLDLVFFDCCHGQAGRVGLARDASGPGGWSWECRVRREALAIAAIALEEKVVVASAPRTGTIRVIARMEAIVPNVAPPADDRLD